MAISPMAIVHTVLAAAVVGLLLAAVPAGAADVLARRVGKPVDVASSAYLYRADRAAEQNPPEAWILLMQFANQPFAKPIDRTAPAMRRALCGLQWE